MTTGVRRCKFESHILYTDIECDKLTTYETMRVKYTNRLKFNLYKSPNSNPFRKIPNKTLLYINIGQNQLAMAP